MSLAQAEFSAGKVLSHSEISPFRELGQPRLGAKYARVEQSLRSPFNYEKYAQVLEFNSPNFNRRNTIQIPALPMVVEEMWVELNMTASVSGSTSEAFQATQTWIDAEGVSLNYIGNRVYNMSEAEGVYDSYLHSGGEDLIPNLLAMNDRSNANRITNNTNNVPYYISLRPLANKILGKVGCVGSFAPNSWEVSVPLRSLASVVNASTATAVSGTVSSMRLILYGHRCSPSEIEAHRQRLANGVLVHYVDSNHRRETYAASASSVTVTLSELEGNASDLAMLHRVQAGWNSTTPNTKNNLNWQLFNALADTVELGRISNPVEIFGVAMPDRRLRLLGENSYAGSSNFLDAEGSLRQPSITCVPFSEVISDDHRDGLSSGTYAINNDLRIKYNFSTTTTANFLDILVFIHKALSISHDGAVVNNAK